MDWSPLWISIKTGIVGGVITFFTGIVAAYFVLQMKSRILRMIIDTLFTLSLVLPPTVVGFFLLTIIGVKHPIGEFFANVLHVKLTFSWISTVIAAVVISFPLMYRSAKAAMEQVDVNLIYAARTLGQRERFIFRKIILPNAMPGIISGGMLSFARGLGEFGATAMVAGNIYGKTRTLSLAVYSEVAAGNMDKAYDYVLILTIIAFVSLVVIHQLDHNYYKQRGD